MVTTKMNWSGPNCDFLPNWITIWTWPIHFGCDHFILVVTKSLWSSQINLVRPKPFWTDRNCFGHIEGQGISAVISKEIEMAAKATSSFGNSHRNLCNVCRYWQSFQTLCCKIDFTYYVSYIRSFENPKIKRR